MARTSKQILHDRALMVAQSYLYKNGHKIQVMKETHCPFDILVDGKIKCEVKSAEIPQPKPGLPWKIWRFNLHRHGILPEKQADVYWLHIIGLPDFKHGISLIVPHEEIKGRTNLDISVRSLLTHWSKWYMRMDLFQTGT